ncbi:hypothetical protein Scep_024692 [Stephania cephalantha]|uniref:Uncharacterized protein n=1 Tax=Stephania cephalantha TaxID=152367 RepID=A0AAP0HXC8_9MAGN
MSTLHLYFFFDSSHILSPILAITPSPLTCSLSLSRSHSLYPKTTPPSLIFFLLSSITHNSHHSPLSASPPPTRPPCGSGGHRRR